MVCFSSSKKGMLINGDSVAQKTNLVPSFRNALEMDGKKNKTNG
jgi:hypothetical protein